MKEKVVENLHLLYAAKPGFVNKRVYWLTFPINCVSDRCNIIILFVYCTMQRHLHQHFIGCLGQPHFFLILVNDFVTCPTRLLDGNFFFKPWVPFRRVQECNHILPGPSYKPGHYLINSWRKAISLSCSALSIICHALLMSMTSLPSGGT